MRIKSFKKFLACYKGVVAIEMAFILPMLMLLYFGLLDVTRYISQSRQITSIAGTVGDLVGQELRFITHVNSTTGDFADYFRVGTMVMKPASDNDLRIRVSAYRMVNSTFTRVWSVNNGKGTPCASNPTNADIQYLMDDGRDVIVAQACGKIKLASGHLLAFYRPSETDFNVEHFVMLKPRLSNTLQCYTSASTTTGNSNCGIPTND